MKNNSSAVETISSSGVCRMGSVDVAYYLKGKRLWFDKKSIEKVLTGKNQHNLLGQYKDPKNHAKVFDPDRKAVVDIISKTGVHNYLRKAWSVKEENRHDFYAGIKAIEDGKSTVTEPLQMPFFNGNVPVKVNSFIKISENDGQYSVDFTVDGKTFDEKKQCVARMLIAVANTILTGNSQDLELREVA
jgi:hypothetical protein